jgi:membrane-bound lytic murein transglycosylase D
MFANINACANSMAGSFDKDTLNRSAAGLNQINKVLEQGIVPDENQAVEIGSITRYGFKDLFNAYGYDSKLPYANQINPRAELYMSSYLQRHRRQLLELKEYSLPYFKLIEHIFRQYGLPPELKYLAVIESHLKTTATSHAGAAGPWQFMPETARRYGLQVTRNLDERRDFFRSTHAAAKFLLKLFREFNDWLLVIAAYNGGEGRVYQAMKKSDNPNFWNLQHYLPEESRNHVKKFIATHYLMENDVKNKSGNTTLSWQSPLGERKLSQGEINSMATLTISGKYIASVIASTLEMTTEEFERINPDLDMVLEKTGQYDMILPENKMKTFLLKKYEILQECIRILLNDNDTPLPKTIRSTTPAH